MNGQSFSGTSYQLDGTDNRDPILGIIVINPTLESIGETKITSQNYDAEFGQAIAGVVSVQTKSGGNTFHGSAFEFYQSDRFQSRNPFTQAQPNALTGKFLPDTQKNQFGGSLGGRLVENRLFFFGDYQGRRNTEGGSRLLSVPTPAARRGDLSAYGVNIYDPLTGVPAVRTQFPGNVIPTGRLSPQAQAILALIPLPNAPGRDNGTRDNYVASNSETFNEDSFNVRVDGRLKNGANTFGRYSRGKFLRDGPTAFGPGGGRELVSLGGVSDVKNQSLAYGIDVHGVVDAARRLPVRLLPLQRQRPAVRLRHHAGCRRRHSRPEPRHHLHLGPAGRRRRPQRRPRVHLRLQPRCEPLQLPARAGRVSVPAGRQRDQTGRRPYVQGRRRRPPRAQPPRAQRRAPVGAADVRADPHAGRRTAGSGLATFLLGDVTSFGRFVSTSTDARELQWRHFYYAQDTWRFNPKLTLNYGVRLDVINPQTVNEAGNGGFLDLTTGEILVAGVGGIGLNGNVEELLQLGAAPRRDLSD